MSINKMKGFYLFILAGLAFGSLGVALIAERSSGQLKEIPKIQALCDIRSRETKTFYNGQEANHTKKSASVSEVFIVPESSTVLAIVDGNVAVFESATSPSDWRVTYKHEGWHVNHLIFTDSRSGYGIGQNGVLIKTEDAGNSWTKVPVESNFDFISADFFNRNLGYVVGQKVIIDRDTDRTTRQIEVLSTSNGGVSWESSFFDDGSQNSFSIFKIMTLNEKEAVAVINGSRLLRTLDGGASWQTVEPNGLRGVTDIAKSPDGALWAISNQGDFASSSNHGASWSRPASFPKNLVATQWNSINFSKNGNGLATSQEGVILATNNGGRSWIEIGEKSGESPMFATMSDKLALIKGSNTIFKVNFE